MDLLEVNAGIVSEVTKNILKHSDNPIIAAIPPVPIGMLSCIALDLIINNLYQINKNPISAIFNSEINALDQTIRYRQTVLQTGRLL